MRIGLAIVLSTSFALRAGGCQRFEPVAAPPRAAAKGPLTVHAANPRYLDDGSGRAVLLVGSHTWTNLQDEGETDPPAAFDFDAYLQMLSDHNHNFIRLWRWEQPAYRYELGHDMRYCQPQPWQRSGPGLAADGKPKFDLTRFDDAYFARLRQRVEAAGKRGIYVGVMLFEGHALSQAADAWASHPLNAANNINGLDADANHDGRGTEWQSLAKPAIMALQEAYMRKVVQTVNDLDNVLYEVCNEAHGDSDAWQRYVIDFVRDVEAAMPKQHLVIYSAPVGTHGEFMWASNAAIVSPGKKKEGDRIPLRDDPPATDGRKVVMLDTDHLWGCGGEAAWVFKAFTRGYHAIYMDPWLPGGGCGKPDKQMRCNLGYALRYADRVDLASMKPRGDLASTRFCLASPGRAYLVYLPSGGAVDVDLGEAGQSASFDVEWFSPGRDDTQQGQPIVGGANRTLQSPFSGDALLLLQRQP